MYENKQQQYQWSFLLIFGRKTTAEFRPLTTEVIYLVLRTPHQKNTTHKTPEIFFIMFVLNTGWFKKNKLSYMCITRMPLTFSQPKMTAQKSSSGDVSTLYVRVFCISPLCILRTFTEKLGFCTFFNLDPVLRCFTRRWEFMQCLSLLFQNIKYSQNKSINQIIPSSTQDVDLNATPTLFCSRRLA